MRHGLRNADGRGPRTAVTKARAARDAVLAYEVTEVEDLHICSAVITRSAITSQLYSATQGSSSSEPSPAAEPRSASWSFTASAIADAVESHMMPYRDRATRCWARLSGADVVTTATPQARGSSTAIPNPSRADGRTNTFAAFTSS